MTQLASELTPMLLPPICPRCAVPLALQESRHDCGKCGSHYPIRPWGMSFLIDSEQAMHSEGQSEKDRRDRDAYEYDQEQLQIKTQSFLNLQADLLIRGMSDAPSGPVLDVGCGTGLMTEHYVRMGRPIVALDFSEKSLFVLADKKLPHVTAIHGDASALPFGNSAFGAVVAHGVIQHMPLELHSKAMQEFFRSLKPGGKLALTVFNAEKFAAAGWPKTGTFPNSSPYISHDLDELMALAKQAGFSDVQIRPMGLFLYWHSLRIRGATRVYRTFAPVLNWIERKIHSKLRPNRKVRSEYWIMVATKANS